MGSAPAASAPPAARVAPALVVDLDALARTGEPAHVALCLRCDRRLPGRHALRSSALDALHAHGVTSHGTTP